ncbi:MAG: Phosphotransferase enzyme family [Candidatus Saccharibacteria bacterium]|nr:Phosphotransferase enzyme family [Candidatus Saccharibacteria bacterium]
MVYQVAIKEVLKAYGISYVRIHDSQKGYRNEIWPVETADGRMINVTFYKREDGIVERMRRADTVSEYLAGCGMPTRQRIDSRMLQLKSSSGITSIGVYTYLPGATIPWEAYTMTHLKLLGKTMSDMHARLDGLVIDAMPSVYDEYQMIIARMQEYFTRPSVIGSMNLKLHVGISIDKLNEYSQLLGQLQLLPDQQVLHMDFVRGNILFKEAMSQDMAQFDGLAISGILDFEKTALGHPSMDIARTLAFLLVDCKYKPADKVQKYFLHSGYQKRGQRIDSTQPDVLGALVELFLVYDFYKFLRHNPYEFLDLNAHYTRTRDILKRQNVIRY